MLNSLLQELRALRRSEIEGNNITYSYRKLLKRCFDEVVAEKKCVLAVQIR